MPKYFTSVLRVVPRTRREKGEKIAVRDEKSVIFTSQQLAQVQPHPPSVQQQIFTFDRVYSTSDDNSCLYKHSIKEIVESALLGYHGTVLSFGPELGDSKNSLKEDLISRAAEQIFRCVKKSLRAHSASNLVVLCSFVVVIDETIHDLLDGFPDGAAKLSSSDGTSPHEDALQIPKLSLINENVIGASIQQAKTTSQVVALVEYGSEMEQMLLRAYGRGSQSLVSHHTIFRLTVECAQFGTMNAPVSGNLSFVDVGAADPLACRQKHTSGDRVDRSVLSLFKLADMVTAFSPSDEQLGSKSGSVFDLDDDAILPCVPKPQTSELCNSSVLTQLLKEALGGNCKTLLICQTPEAVAGDKLAGVYEALKLASRARRIQNSPNKRVFAEKALMSAYAKELQLQYGEGWMAQEEPLKLETVTISQAQPQQPAVGMTPVAEKKTLSGSRSSVVSEDLDSVYDQLISSTAGEQSQYNVELAASALAAAVGEGDSSDESEGEDNAVVEVSATHKSPHKRLPIKLKKKVPGSSALSSSLGLERPSSSSLSNRDVTIEALVAILQDPDQGVPRARTTTLKDVKIRKDVGALFTGADIVHWMVECVAGVKDEEDAEVLGQLLLDEGAIFHSEGSAVFANAETLFYYARPVSPTVKPLSREEIQDLLMQMRDAESPNLTTVKALDSEEDGLEEGPSEITPVEKFGGGEESSGSDSELRIVTSKKQQPAPSDVPSGADCPAPPSPSPSRSTAKVRKKGGRRTRGAPPAPLPPETPEGHGRSSYSPEADSPEGQADLTSDRAQAGYHSSCWVGDDTHGGAESEGVCPADGVHPARQTKGILPHDAEQLQDLSDEADGSGDPTLAHPELSYMYEDEEEEQVATGEPDTAHLKRIPSIHTLENTVDYPHPLHMAVAIGKHPGVIRNLVMMFGVDKCDEYGRTPLMFAALGNKRSSCTTLIECGADVNHCDSSGLTALQVACYHGNREALGVLINKKASVDIKDKLGHSSLHWSTVPASHSCLQQVLSHTRPSLLQHIDRDELTALHWAIYYNHPQHLKMLLSGYDDPLELDPTGRTFMTYAIERNAMQCMQVLLSSCPALLIRPDAGGCTPLHHASAASSPELLYLLLSYRAPKGVTPVDINVNCEDLYRRTPLHCAVARNRPMNAKLLISRGAVVEVADSEGRTPLDYAKELGETAFEIFAILEGDPGSSREEDNASPSKETEPSGSKVCSIL